MYLILLLQQLNIYCVNKQKPKCVKKNNNLALQLVDYISIVT